MAPVRVFKTDVNDRSKAKTILDEIRRLVPGSDPNLDLEDCDKVLRVENSIAEIDESEIRKILSNYGYKMEVLP